MKYLSVLTIAMLTFCVAASSDDSVKISFLNDGLLTSFKVKPEHKAFAAAMDVNAGKVENFVVSEAFGQATLDEAMSEALKSCNEARTQAKIQDECRVYAKNAEVMN